MEIASEKPHDHATGLTHAMCMDLRVCAVDSEQLGGFMRALGCAADKLQELLAAYEDIDNRLPGAEGGRLRDVMERSVALAGQIRGSAHNTMGAVGQWLSKCACCHCCSFAWFWGAHVHAVTLHGPLLFAVRCLGHAFQCMPRITGSLATPERRLGLACRSHHQLDFEESMLQQLDCTYSDVRFRFQ